ncbi:GH25 family lysozyme [Butyrivibrio sp. MC2013]|uniref:GH25 family lysozyme n=1 Tax=Butyrivibrio sp. MC2013 TaxID=1280686 RepID=UPI00040704B1|nr:GH25 family lysozyme [Butyrivibrio sp. MC2013]
MSHYQGDINWREVAGSGKSFAFVRMGTSKTVDRYYAENLIEAAQAGLRVGAYWYSYAMTVEQIEAESYNLINMLAPFEISFPVALDLEADCQKSLSSPQLQALVDTFCRVIYSAGYTPVIYTYRNWFVNRLGDTSWHKWVAQYSDSLTMPYSYAIWQYSSHGEVAGIKGRVDLDRLYIDYFGLIPREGFAQRDGGSYYYRNFRRQKGWVYPEDGGRYFCDPATGKVWTGWANDGSGSYYLDPYKGGRAAVGSCLIENDEYYFDEKGMMQTGFLEGCYYGGDGRMIRGRIFTTGGMNYLASESGRILGGIRKVGDDIYAFDKTDGHMIAGFVKKGTGVYYFGRDGRMLKNGSYEDPGALCTFDENGKLTDFPEGFSVDIAYDMDLGL